MIRAMFFDIDGTLVSFKTHEIPSEVVDALYKIKEKGVRMFIASGRPPHHLTYLPKSLNDFPWDGMVLFNGQYCIDAEKKVIRQTPIPRTAVEQLVPYLKNDFPYAVSFFTLTDSFDISFNEGHYNYLKSLNRLDEMPEIKDPSSALDMEIYQICPRIPEEMDDEFISHAPGTKSARWTPDFADIIPADGGKPEGMKTMMELYGIQPEETIAFGDGGNDISMLEYANIGVAMGNASDEVKSHADYVTDDVDDLGLLHAFQHFGLIES